MGLNAPGKPGSYFVRKGARDGRDPRTGQFSTVVTKLPNGRIVQSVDRELFKRAVDAAVGRKK